MQKTAYGLRISDWSSDVCSSDLEVIVAGGGRFRLTETVETDSLSPDAGFGDLMARLAAQPRRTHPNSNHAFDTLLVERSEEHTSELQSLMRISYAVFCLKKKNIKTHTQIQ